MDVPDVARPEGSEEAQAKQAAYLKSFRKHSIDEATLEVHQNWRVFEFVERKKPGFAR
jgi:hypothetical protein